MLELLDLVFVKSVSSFLRLFCWILRRSTLYCALYFMDKLSASSADFDSSFVFYVVPAEFVCDTSKTEA